MSRPFHDSRGLRLARAGASGSVVSSVILRAVAVAIVATALATSCLAQKKGDSELRTVHGTAIDLKENPVPMSVVYLLNVKSQAITTRIADDAGGYRFSGLDPNVDYEVHAEHDEMTSPTRKISSFDSRRDIEVTLKLSKKKTER